MSDLPGAPGKNYAGNADAGPGGRSLLSPGSWFSFRGRMARKEYWIRVLILFAFTFVLGFMWVYLDESSADGSGFGGYVLGLAKDFRKVTSGDFLFLCGLFAASISNISIYARRLHDCNQSGWWVIPVLAASRILILNIAILLILGCIRGTIGQNRFGPDPRGTAA